jgi:hypothetical protein
MNIWDSSLLAVSTKKEHWHKETPLALNGKNKAN